MDNSKKDGLCLELRALLAKYERYDQASGDRQKIYRKLQRQILAVCRELDLLDEKDNVC